VNTPTRSLDEVFAVCRFLKDFPCLWWLGGGWAIDAWLGEQSRDHEDIEICVARQDQVHIYRYCTTWEFYTPVNDEWAALPAGEHLYAPRFMLQLRRVPQTIDPGAGMPPSFEFLLNEVEDGRWTFLRDRQLQLPLEQVYDRSSWGMQVARPEIQLLHKAVYRPRPKDDHDFQHMLPHLRQNQRVWLRQHIMAVHPDHPWLAYLA